MQRALGNPTQDLSQYQPSGIRKDITVRLECGVCVTSFLPSPLKARAKANSPFDCIRGSLSNYLGCKSRNNYQRDFGNWILRRAEQRASANGFLKVFLAHWCSHTYILCLVGHEASPNSISWSFWFRFFYFLLNVTRNVTQSQMCSWDS